MLIIDKPFLVLSTKYLYIYKTKPKNKKTYITIKLFLRPAHSIDNHHYVYACLYVLLRCIKQFPLEHIRMFMHYTLRNAHIPSYSLFTSLSIHPNHHFLLKASAHNNSHNIKRIPPHYPFDFFRFIIIIKATSV